MKTFITSETFVPLSVMGAIMGGVAWLTTLYNATTANATAIHTVQIVQKEDRRRIESKLDHILADLDLLTARMAVVDERTSSRK